MEVEDKRLVQVEQCRVDQTTRPVQPLRLFLKSKLSLRRMDRENLLTQEEIQILVVELVVTKSLKVFKALRQIRTS